MGLMAKGEGIYEQLKQSDVMTKIIVINAAVFLLIGIVSAIMQWPSRTLYQYFALPDGLISFLGQPWSLVTYSFLHSGFLHLLFNMLWLQFFGRFVLNLFPERRFVSLYLLGAVSGGVLYLLAFNTFPAFVQTDGQLVGASASIMAVMAFAAVYSPYASVRLLVFDFKLWQVAAFMVCWDLFRLPSMQNAGGLIAHLGGAGFGYVYARNLQQGKDIGRWFDVLIDRILNGFQKDTKQGGFTKVYRTPKAKTNKPSQTKSSVMPDNQARINVILDKISLSGYDSLSKEEKDFLFRSGNDL
jgi:membrane associated rhomboid family serine protease